MLSPEPPRFPVWLFTLGWWLTNGLSWALVGAFFHNFNLLLSWPPTPAKLGAFDFGPAVVGLLMGSFPALLPGVLQWWLLRRYWPISRWWLVTVAAGIGLEHFLADGFPNARDLSWAVLASSLVLGMVQWWLLRLHLRASGWWVAAAAVGWLLGWVVGLNWLTALGLFRVPWTPTLGLQHHGLLGLTIGSAYSLLTGNLLGWQLRRPTSQEPMR